MREIFISRKGTFLCNEKVINIKDEKGKDFYFFMPKKFPFTFNMPRGKYYTNNKLTRVSFYDPANSINLPPKQKNKIIPKKIQELRFSIIRNPSKASIAVDKHFVMIDPQMIKKTLPEILFILFHEFGHYYYFDEEKCDAYAKKQMLRLGYNPSQISAAINNTLSNKQCERKKLIFNSFKNGKN